MTLNKRLPIKKEGRFPADLSDVAGELNNLLREWIPADRASDIVIVCIGTDRSTGDSLGPLTGTLLNQKNTNNFTVYGTLESPVHAVNLEETVAAIYHHHQNPYVIAIDASLGKLKSVGSIVAAQGPVKPGAALKKPLPEIGDMHITGIVNISGAMEFFVLQNTRLHVVMELAQKISRALHQLDASLSKSTASFLPVKRQERNLFSKI